MQVTENNLKLVNSMYRNFSSIGYRSEECMGLNGEKIVQVYAPPELLEPAMEKFIREFDQMASTARTLSDKVRALAYFWTAFVLYIHPFVDKNGATARHFLKLYMEKWGIKCAFPERLGIQKRTGNFKEDVKNIETQFYLLIGAQI